MSAAGARYRKPRSAVTRKGVHARCERAGRRARIPIVILATRDRELFGALPSACRGLLCGACGIDAAGRTHRPQRRNVQLAPGGPVAALGNQRCRADLGRIALVACYCGWRDARRDHADIDSLALCNLLWNPNGARSLDDLRVVDALGFSPNFRPLAGPAAVVRGGDRRRVREQRGQFSRHVDLPVAATRRTRTWAGRINDERSRRDAGRDRRTAIRIGPVVGRRRRRHGHVRAATGRDPADFSDAAGARRRG